MKATMKESFLNTSPKTIQEEQGVQSPVPGERIFVTKAFFGVVLLDFREIGGVIMGNGGTQLIHRVQVNILGRHLYIDTDLRNGSVLSLGDSRNCMSSVQKSKRGSSGVNAETDSFDDTDDLKESPIPNMESSTVMEEIDAKHRLSESSEDPEEDSGEEDQHISKGEILPK
ncbi:hypothetical protein IFM89_015263 [Coptis chinensis]|uniref:Uncharacterized protein n=1 Tax=Coptis chinensis TaxID=261450 RepID=A0A835HEV1_9MAGN|nr:hypothetical protein IFM89_015263 [Coptis chinensis]